MNYYELTHKELVALLIEKDEKLRTLQNEIFYQDNLITDALNVLYRICKYNYSSVVMAETDISNLIDEGYAVLAKVNNTYILHKPTSYLLPFFGAILGLIIFSIGILTVKFGI
jgi:hypothetical protein